MPHLTYEVRAEIVRKLACFERPADIVRSLKEDGIELEIRHVVYHDPTRFAGRKLAPKWRVLFEGIRKGFLANIENIPIANQNFRLAALNTMYEDAIKAKNRVQAQSVLEQAAKEVGGIYSNVRTLHTPDMDKTGSGLPAHERQQALADLVDKALGRMKVIEASPSGAKSVT